MEASGGGTVAKLARFAQDGLLDNSFGDNGIVSIGSGNEENYDRFLSVANQRDGKIVAGGLGTFRFNATWFT